MAATLGNLQTTMEILSRLPPETLLRLKSVHKSWYALINDPKFVSKHFSNSLQHIHIFLKRVVTNNSGNKKNMFSILSLDPSLSVIHVDLSCYEHPQCFEIHGHSHGLICVSDLDMDVFLCNPTTREFRKLPPSILPITGPACEPDGYDSCMNAVGFGYDSNARDFKVVRIVDYFEGFGYFLPPKAEIYELSKDRWREIEPPVGRSVFWMPSFEMYYEGTYYWWANDDREGENIESFNMSEEIFGKISLPESFKDTQEQYRSLGVLNGSIVAFSYPPEGNEKTFDIWEMKKDECNVVSWSKLLTIGPISEIDKPLLFVNSDELLMEGNEGRVILYNIKTQQMNVLPLEGKGIPDSFHATLLTKSLVSVIGNNCMSYGF